MTKQIVLALEGKPRRECLKAQLNISRHVTMFSSLQQVQQYVIESRYNFCNDSSKTNVAGSHWLCTRTFKALSLRSMGVCEDVRSRDHLTKKSTL